jgi:hypothetical protein
MLFDDKYELGIAMMREQQHNSSASALENM